MDNERFERGMEMLRQVDGELGDRVVESLSDVAPDLARLMVEFAFGDVYVRPALNLRDRELATIAALAAKGGCEPQLKVHVNGALNVGLTRDEIVETFLQIAVYAGFPAALNAVFAAKAVFAERDG
ncbi:carboxymuconolactone decarboxylase family protein [Pseudodesulfovibrio indicus]|uniref:carboxymuconolactone decarboxylase family protein n=1 Tax=Pseudodesulfovibrio indicus TaxID=1716143 RepID=UPI0029305235|nr:carboxymuconolactone decarboxylase family protein [Pseudodesulfovibrio indicus]